MEFTNTTNAGEKYIISQAKKNKRPIYGNLELTPLCNMDCAMCFVRLSRNELDSRGRLRSADEWLSLARQMADSGVLYLQLTGGEPLTYPGFKELYIGLKEMGMILTLNTNGTLIDETWADFFAAHRPRRINISLYGINDQAYTELCRFPGGFARTISGIRLLRERDIDVKLNVPQTFANKEDLASYDAICEEFGTAIHCDTYIFPAQRERSSAFRDDTRPSPEESAKARFEQMKKEMGEEFQSYLTEELAFIDSLPENAVFSRKMECLASTASFIVNWQGMLRPCIMLNEPEVPVFDLGFEKAWKLIRERTEKMLLPDVCGSCRVRTLCNVCAASAILEQTDENGAPVYICRTTRELERLMRQEVEHE